MVDQWEPADDGQKEVTWNERLGGRGDPAS